MYTVKVIVYWMRQKAAELRGKESFQYEEITFHTTDGEPYLEGLVRFFWREKGYKYIKSLKDATCIIK